jgi:hypothetical protein
MRLTKRNAVRVAAAALVGLWSAPAAAQAPPPTPSASSAKAKELVELMKAKKLEAFAVKDASTPGRFIAVMYIPDVQILLVSAAYSRPTDIDYRLYQKDYATAYRDLSSSVFSSDKFTVEDTVCDGLVAVPVKNMLPDSASSGTTSHRFEGPADPKKRNDKRMAAEPYHKAFNDVDQRYAQALSELIAELKKAGTLASPSPVR